MLAVLVSHIICLSHVICLANKPIRDALTIIAGCKGSNIF